RHDPSIRRWRVRHHQQRSHPRRHDRKVRLRLSVGHDQTAQWRNRDALAFRSNKFNLQTEYALSSDSKLSVSGGLVDTNRFDGPVTTTSFNAATPALGYANV